MVMSGLPLSLIAKFYNWHTTFIMLGYLSMASAMIAYFSQWPTLPTEEDDKKKQWFQKAFIKTGWWPLHIWLIISTVSLKGVL